MIHTLKIDGMSCHHCVAAVKKELERVVGLTLHEVGIGFARVEYDEHAVPENAIRRAVEDAGYTLAAIA
jgi:copper chaperone